MAMAFLRRAYGHASKGPACHQLRPTVPCRNIHTDYIQVLANIKTWYDDGALNEKTMSKNIRHVLKQCQTSEEYLFVVEKHLPFAGLKPDIPIFNMYIRQLMLEGEKQKAWAVMERTIPEAELEPDEYTMDLLNRTEEELKRMRAIQLRDWFRPERRPGVSMSDMVNQIRRERAQAQVLFDKLVAKGNVAPDHFNTLMTILTATEQKSMIKRDMPAAGVEPNRVTFNTLITALLIEGDEKGAQEVFQKMMPLAGVAPNGRTMAQLGLPETALERLRTARLHFWVKDKTEASLTRANDLFSKLKACGKVNVLHFNVMMAACDSPAEIQHMIRHDLPAAGLEPGVNTFNTLITNMRFSGYEFEAWQVVERIMPMAGVEPDERTIERLETPEDLYTPGRTAKLRDWLADGTPEGKEKAFAFFDLLKVTGRADMAHYEMMVQACDTDEKMREVLRQNEEDENENFYDNDDDYGYNWEEEYGDWRDWEGEEDDEQAEM